MEDLKLKIKLEHPNAKMPVKATDNAACWDVFAADIRQETDDLYIVDLGFKLQPPKGYKVVLVPRSSITKSMAVMQNSPGQGDGDYRGTYQLRFRMLPVPFELGIIYESLPYTIDDRVGQIYLEKVNEFILEESDSLDDTERGSGGFGSTGK